MVDHTARWQPWVLDVWRRQPGLLHGYVLDVALPIALGAFTLLGGWERVAGRGWTTMREYGGPYLWGTVLIINALVLITVPLVARARTITWTLRCTAIVYGLAGLWFLQAALLTGTSFWGTVLSLYAAANQITRANAYREAR